MEQESLGKMKFVRFDEPFELENGEKIEDFTVAYHTYGKLNSKGDNCVWVCHALTADSEVAEWWPNTVVKDGFLDPEKYFIVCANILGSCYGTTGPLSINKATGKPWYDKFPRYTVRDVVKAHRLLADKLGISRIFSLIGSSVGGFQAVEWAVMEPERFDSVVLIATEAKASPWAIAIDETQRMSILSDQTYGEPRADAAQKGLAAARAIGLLSYRGPWGYNKTQQNHPTENGELPSVHRACTYQRYQGEKLVRRFNAYSYVSILDMFDTHDVGRGRGGVDKALRKMTMPVLTVGITTDIIFTPEEMKELDKKLPDSRYEEIASEFGHDGFLVEHESLNKIVNKFFKDVRY